MYTGCEFTKLLISNGKNIIYNSINLWENIEQYFFFKILCLFRSLLIETKMYSIIFNIDVRFGVLYVGRQHNYCPFI